jgi:hypothetical protein
MMHGELSNAVRGALVDMERIAMLLRTALYQSGEESDGLPSWHDLCREGSDMLASSGRAIEMRLPPTDEED